MLKNYIKIAFRNFWRHSTFSFINILGISIGMAACFLIFLYLRFELSYDRFNTKSDRIYRLVTDAKTNTDSVHWYSTAPAMAINIKADFPEVEKVVRLNPNNFLITRGNTKYLETNGMFVDSSFFSIFDLPLIHGDPSKVLSVPFQVVLSVSASRKYFGNANPVGQTLLLTDKNLILTVSGVMKDIPENSQFRPDFLVSAESAKQFDATIDIDWWQSGLVSYLLLKPGASAAKLEAKLPAFLEKHIGKEMKRDQTSVKLSLERFEDVYLKSDRGGFVSGNINNIYIFSIIAAFILIIAIVNFINLSTARATERAREVGIRKVIGAEKSQLIIQFLGESALICILAFFLSILFSVLLLPLFNQMAGKLISEGVFSHSSDIAGLLVLDLIIALVAGIYPALVLSSFEPMTMLKGRFAGSRKGLRLRMGLVVSQFTISIALILGTIIVFKQLSFMRRHELGFNKDQILVIDTHGEPKREAFKQEIKSVKSVLSASLSSNIPGTDMAVALSKIENARGEMQTEGINLYLVDYDFTSVYKTSLIAGRGFSKEFATDENLAMIINESAVKHFGFQSPQEAIGRKFSQWGKEGKIIGVLKDFHYKSMQEKIKPLCLRVEPLFTDQLSIRISPVNMAGTIKAIQRKWEAVNPNTPFNYYFLDQAFDKLYNSEERFGKLFFDFSVLAILISCLGLLGLAAFTTLQRTKEIGVRKLLGASISNILQLLSIDFLRLVLLAFLIASPITWIAMHKWMQGFAYRAEISWWIFLFAGILAILIAFAAIGINTIRAAMANPVKSLRSE